MISEKIKRAAVDPSGIFKQSWKLTDAASNFETALCKEVLYLKQMNQEYENLTNQAWLGNSELGKEKLLSRSRIPGITGETNVGSILKNRRPTKQMRSFSLSQLNAREISRRQSKRNARN